MSLWEIYGEIPSEGNPVKILKNYAEQLHTDTDGKFSGLVTQTVKEDSGIVTYALYIVVPELKDYMYRIIEVNIPNLVNQFPLEIRLFAKDPVNHRALLCNNIKDYSEKLLELIKSPITKGILMHLKNLIELNQEN